VGVDVGFRRIRTNVFLRFYSVDEETKAIPGEID